MTVRALQDFSQAASAPVAGLVVMFAGFLGKSACVALAQVPLVMSCIFLLPCLCPPLNAAVTRQKILIWLQVRCHQPPCQCFESHIAPGLFVCLQWVYWLSPFSWSIRSVALNEFNAHSYDFNVSTPSGLMRAGHWYLEVGRLIQLVPSVCVYLPMRVCDSECVCVSVSASVCTRKYDIVCV